MLKKICNYPGCTRLINPGEKYCPEHTREPVRKEPFKKAFRSNAPLYNSAKWRKLRSAKIKENPWCAKCGADKHLEVHHLIPPRGNEELFFDADNIIVVCESCHRIITNAEIRKRRRG
jgi:5-methylcytosine-specific restriction protein A